MVGQQCTDRELLTIGKIRLQQAGFGFASLNDTSLVCSSSRNVTTALTFCVCVFVSHLQPIEYSHPLSTSKVGPILMGPTTQRDTLKVKTVSGTGLEGWLGWLGLRI